MRKVVSCLVLFMLFVAFPAFAKKGKAGKKIAKADEKVAEPVVPATPQEDGKILHTFSRTIDFDPHPTIVEPLGAESLALDGKKISYTVEFLENWDAKNAEPVLKELGFRVVLLSDGKEVKTIEIPKKAIDSKSLKKGFVFGMEKYETLGVKFEVEDRTLAGKNVSGLVVVGKLLGFGESAENTENAETAAPASEPVAAPGGEAVSAAVTQVKPDAGLKMAQQLAQKADEMAESAVAGKIMLYKKAVGMLDENVATGDVAAFVNEVREKIAGLEAAHPPIKTASGTINAASAPETGGKVSLEAQKMYDEAEKLFGMGKEPEARDQLRKAVEKDPEFHAAWVLLAKNALGNSKYAKAKEAAEKALSLKDSDVDSAVIYFKSCYYLGEPEPGLEKLNALAKRFPEKLAAQTALADAYFQAGDMPNCEETCTKIISAFKSHDRAKELLAKVKEKTK